jgi:hypothetical protein
MEQAFLCTVFSVSGISKVGDRDPFFRDLGHVPWVPTSAARVASRIIPLVEIALAVMKRHKEAPMV